MLMQGITYNTTRNLVVGIIMILIPIFARASAVSSRTVSEFAGRSSAWAGSSASPAST